MQGDSPENTPCDGTFCWNLNPQKFVLMAKERYEEVRNDTSQMVRRMASGFVKPCLKDRAIRLTTMPVFNNKTSPN